MFSFFVLDHQVRKKKKKSGLRRCDFTEGWVEFRDKRVAKRVVTSLHNTPMATRKRQRFCSDLWCMKVPLTSQHVIVQILAHRDNTDGFFFKYLHRFQWTHLSERLAYEQTVLQQRLRTEVSQAKRETNFYLNNVEKRAHLDQVKKKKLRDGKQVQRKNTMAQSQESLSGSYNLHLSPLGRGKDMGLHTETDRRGDPDEEEEEDGSYEPEEPGQDFPCAAEEPIKCLTPGQDLQLQKIRVRWANHRRSLMTPRPPQILHDGKTVNNYTNGELNRKNLFFGCYCQ